MTKCKVLIENSNYTYHGFVIQLRGFFLKSLRPTFNLEVLNNFRLKHKKLKFYEEMEKNI